MIADNQATAARARIGFALATVLLLAACGDASNENAQAPAAVTTGNAVASAPAGGSADATGNSDNAVTPDDDSAHAAMMNDRAMSERHRQEMDHESMRRGGPDNSHPPMPEASPANESAPMHDM